ncbi:hypothetical protein RFI_08207, partial [Reticulomyxa filosa]
TIPPLCDQEKVFCGRWKSRGNLLRGFLVSALVACKFRSHFTPFFFPVPKRYFFLHLKKKYWNSVTGHFEPVNKYIGKKISCNEFVDYLIRFFSVIKTPEKEGDDDDNNDNEGEGGSDSKPKTCIRTRLVECMFQKINELRQVMSLPCSYRFLSSSLLLAYEGLCSDNGCSSDPSSSSLSLPSLSKSKGDDNSTILQSPTVSTSSACDRNASTVSNICFGSFLFICIFINSILTAATKYACVFL